MRDAFDGVLDVAARKAAGVPDEAAAGSGAQRQVPHLPPSVFDGCDHDAVRAIGSDIAAAVNSGAPLYNDGNVEACYRIYEGAISDIDRNVAGCPAIKQALHDGLGNADRQAGWEAKSWALRDAFDGVTDAIRKR